MSRFLAVFLAAFVPTASAAGHFLKVDINWKKAMTDAEQMVTVYKDQNVTFSWTTGTHDVQKVADKAAFDACTTANMTSIGSQSPLSLGMGSDIVAKEHCVYDKPCYFIGGIAGDCAADQKIAITIKNVMFASKTTDTTKAAVASGASLPTLSATAFLAAIVVSTLI